MCLLGGWEVADAPKKSDLRRLEWDKSGLEYVGVLAFFESREGHYM